ncbi:MAG: YHS domain-containing protein, partial [Myxococcales bacterium]|nr:YHS domain-containing protein [Myxococcales bacterium]
RVAAAEREIAERERRTTPVNDSCPVLDKPIKKTIFSIHEGRRVAFCCPKCKAAFDADPAKYAAKLPPVEAADK